jgi:hypothetical protein
MTRIAGLFFAIALLVGCGNDTPSSPTPTPTLASPSVTVTWEGTLAVGATRFYSFPVSQAGTVNLTLTSLTGSEGELSTPVQISIGFPSGTGCTATSSATTVAGTDVQVSNTFDPGTKCARIADVGNLVAPATFRLLIAYP